MPHERMQHPESELNSQLQRIQQPLWLKGAVTVGGLGLIGLELWWFLNKPKLQKASAFHSTDIHHP